MFSRLILTFDTDISIRNITPEVQRALRDSGLRNGQAILFSRHTTTASTINEDEPFLFEDKAWLTQQLQIVREIRR